MSKIGLLVKPILLSLFHTKKQRKTSIIYLLLFLPVPGYRASG